MHIFCTIYMSYDHTKQLSQLLRQYHAKIKRKLLKPRYFVKTNAQIMYIYPHHINGFIKCTNKHFDQCELIIARRGLSKWIYNIQEHMCEFDVLIETNSTALKQINAESFKTVKDAIDCIIEYIIHHDHYVPYTAPIIKFVH